MCGVEYKGLGRHLVTKQHRLRARVPGKYAALDTLIDKGRTLQQFVNMVKERQTSTTRLDH